MSMTNRVKLAQWDALMLEGLRALGWSDDEVLRKVKDKDLPTDDSMYQFNYEELAAFAEAEPQTFESAVRDGYSIKFNTVRGVRSWIAVALGKEPELVLESGNESVLASLTPAERERVESVLSFGWAVHEEGPGADDGESEYRIAPVTRWEV
jgi:hypothetical protein